MIVPRTIIRSYMQDMLKAELQTDIGEHIFVGRPNPMMIEELPCILISPTSEVIESLGGTAYTPVDYLRTITVNILIMIEQPKTLDDSLKIEDTLDFLSRKIEKSFREDRFFEKRLPGYNSTSLTNIKLLCGSRLVSIDTNTEMDSAMGIATQQLVFELLYEDDTYNTKREKLFESYLIEIRKFGWDETTVDPILIEAEGVIDQ